MSPNGLLHQLTSRPDYFVGRDVELAQLREQVESGCVTISGLQGMGGVGKTALALVLAWGLKSDYPDAQIQLDLKGAHQADEKVLKPVEILSHIVRSFRPDIQLPEDESSLRSFYNAVLNEMKAILFMDNAAGPEQLKPLLPVPRGCLLLITSRQRFELDGWQEINLDCLEPDDAERLLLRLAPRIGALASAMAKLCQYQPFALNLVGSALRRPDKSVEEFMAKLRDKRERIGLIGNAALDMSYELLDEAQQARWRQLAVFPGDFNTAAAGAVWGLEDEDDVKPALNELYAASMVEWSKDSGRWRLHDLAREYAESLLEQNKEEETTARFNSSAHYMNVLTIATELYKQGGENILEGLALFDQEWKSIKAGRDWAAGQGLEDESIVRLVCDYPNAGVYILSLRQHPRERITWLEDASKAACRLKDRINEGISLGNLGNAYADLGKTKKAIEYYEQRIEIAREIGDRRGEGSALGNLGRAYAALGKTKKAIEYFEQRIGIAREIGDRRGEGNALGNLGSAYFLLGKTKKAIEYFEQDLKIRHEIADRQGESAVLGNLGCVYSLLGETKKAIEHYKLQLSIAQEINDRRGEGAAFYNMAEELFKLGKRERAIELTERALKIFEQIDDPWVPKVRAQLNLWREGTTSS